MPTETPATGGASDAFDELIELARKLGITIRHAHLGGAGGGMASFKSQRQLFVDLDADAADQLDRTARALACLPEVQTIYLRPDVRALLDQATR